MKHMLTCHVQKSKSKKKKREIVAGKTVAGVPELVEMILLQLPVKDVLLAQRVDRTWQGVITGSPKLQQALFFRPCSVHKAYVTNSHYTSMQPCRSPAECDPKERRFPIARTAAHDNPYWTTDGKDQVKVLLNPYIQHWGDGYDILYRNRLGKGLGRKHAAFTRPEASWRKMLLTQPPLREAVVDHGKALHWHLLKPDTPDIGITVADWQDSMVRFQQSSLTGSLMGCRPDEEGSKKVVTAQDWLDRMAGPQDRRNK